MNLKDAKPTRKVTAASVGAAVGAIVGWFLRDQLGWDTFPVESLPVVFTFAFGWWVRETST